MRNAIAEKLNENPVIAAVAEPERLPAALASDCGVVFLLSDDRKVSIDLCIQHIIEILNWCIFPQYGLLYPHMTA